MGDITIKIPQKVHRSFQIKNRKSAEEIIKDLERRSLLDDRKTLRNGKQFERLTKLVNRYRSNPDAETDSAIKIANAWREKWNR